MQPLRSTRLPPLVRDLTIDYTALSFVAPEKVRFRYKLEGQDPDWKEVVNDREAHYSNLAPGNYRFHVTACNNSGVWNETGTFLDFSIAPAYYQTGWFRVSCTAAFGALLWCIYRLRVHSIQQRSEQLASINAKLEAQIAERQQAEEALRQAQADLTRANRVSSMGELTASLAHEVNQPIAAAITDANTCLRWLSRDQPDLEEARAAASRMVQDGRRAGEIIKRVRLLFKKDTLQRELARSKRDYSRDDASPAQRGNPIRRISSDGTCCRPPSGHGRSRATATGADEPHDEQH